MKVLYFHQYFSTPKGNAGTRSYLFAEALIKAGHDVEMICLKDSRTNSGLNSAFKFGKREGYVKGIKVIEFNIPYSNYDGIIKRSLSFSFYSIRSALKALTTDADIIFATSTPLTAGVPGIIGRWFKNIPFVFEIRDLWPELPKAMGIVKNPIILNLLSVLENVSYHSADICIGLAPGICKGIEKKNISKNKIYNIPNFCDLSIFKPQQFKTNKKPELIKYIDNKKLKGKFTAAFTGAHGLANGLDYILDAAKILKEKNRMDIHFLLIGEGGCKDNLMKRAESENLTNCSFINSIPKEELSYYFSHSIHIGLMILKNIPEFYLGTSPNKFFDYIASGLPVITNYPGWIADIIKDNKIGYSINQDSPDSFTDVLIHLADNPLIVEKLGINSRKLAVEKFSSNLMTNKFVKIIEESKERNSKYYVASQNYRFIKDCIDKTIALISIIILSPLFLILSFTILINLGLPIFFIQKRPGLNGKAFNLIKFRTMKNELHNKGKVLSDKKRLTTFGKFLRSTSLDELPELINVIKGEMSFIGPRPLLMEYLPLYKSEQSRRHDVKPGISGWAQINGRNNISWEEKFTLDVWYVDNQRFFLDLKILLTTFKKVVRREGISSHGESTMSYFKGYNYD